MLVSSSSVVKREHSSPSTWMRHGDWWPQWAAKSNVEAGANFIYVAGGEAFLRHTICLICSHATMFGLIGGPSAPHKKTCVETGPSVSHTIDEFRRKPRSWCLAPCVALEPKVHQPGAVEVDAFCQQPRALRHPGGNATNWF